METKKRKSNVSFFLNPLSYSTTTSKCRHTNVLLWYQVNKSQSALWLTSKIDKLQANRFWYDCNTIFVKMPFFFHECTFQVRKGRKWSWLFSEIVGSKVSWIKNGDYTRILPFLWYSDLHTNKSIVCILSVIYFFLQMNLIFRYLGK